MPGGDKRFNHIRLGSFLKEAKDHEVDMFKKFLSPGDGRRVQFWRESLVAADQPTRLASLLRDNCKDGPEQLKDVRPDDEEAFKFEDSHSKAQGYASEMKSRMEADLQAKFSKPWPGKDDGLKNVETRMKHRKSSCSIL